MKKPASYLFLLGATLLVFVLVEYFRPKPIDWTPTYANRDAIPYGTKAMYELLPGLFGNQPVRTVRVPVYNHLREATLPGRSSYVFINESFEADENDLRELLAYVARGNRAFVAAHQFPATLADTLGVHATYEADPGRDSTRLAFTNPRLRSPALYAYRRTWATAHLVPDSLPKPVLQRATVLGVNARKRVNFVRIPFGKGAFFLHTVPVAFTNFYVLRQPTAEYAFRALSYLPAGPVFWDEYQKQGRVGEQSLFRFLLNDPALRWAYYLTLATVFLYVLVESRRRQRVIPVVEPPRNTSLEFVETIGQLYFQQGNHADLAEKKIAHWLAFLRQRFNLNTSVFDEEFRQKLVAKSGVSRADVDALLARVEVVRGSGTLTETKLLDLNRRIEAFYDTVHA